MFNAFRGIVTAIFATAAFSMPALASETVDLSNPAFAPVAGPTSIPVGAAEFCKANPAECGAYPDLVAVEALTEARWSELIDINDDVNASVVPVTDEELYQVVEYWTYPAGSGDCEDIALEKRRQLVQRGWDASTLLMTVVRERNGNGHAVLMVRTDRGDLILDNQSGRVLVWNDTPYEFVKRQSQTDAGKWVGLVDQRGMAVAARD